MTILATQKLSGTSIRTRFLLGSGPESSTYAAVSRTAMAIVGAAYSTCWQSSFHLPGLFAAAGSAQVIGSVLACLRGDPPKNHW